METWTIIAVVAGLLTLQGYWIGRSLDSLRNEMVARLDTLDRDVQRLYEHVFKERAD